MDESECERGGSVRRAGEWKSVACSGELSGVLDVRGSQPPSSGTGRQSEAERRGGGG